MIRLKPAIDQPLADKAEDTPVVGVVARYVQPLLQSGQLAMTIPKSPKSRKQKFYTV